MDGAEAGGGDGDDEVTFLLRLKPAPTPPTRRRRPNDDKQTVPKGWDVVIERRDAASPQSANGDAPPPLPPRLQPSAPPPEILDDVHWHPKPYYPYPDYRSQGFLMYQQDLIGEAAVDSFLLSTGSHPQTCIISSQEQSKFRSGPAEFRVRGFNFKLQRAATVTVARFSC
jgi:hypothetical protein